MCKVIFKWCKMISTTTVYHSVVLGEFFFSISSKHKSARIIAQVIVIILRVMYICFIHGHLASYYRVLWHSHGDFSGRSW